MTRRPKLEITLDDDGAPYSATIYLPIDPYEQREPEDVRDIHVGQRQKKPATIIPEVIVLPYGDHTEIIFNIQGDFIIKRKTEPSTIFGAENGFLYNSSLSDFWELAETLLPENEQSRSWLPVYLRDQNSEDFDIVAAKDYYCPGAPDWVSPMDLPKLYSYREEEFQPVDVVQNTVHLPIYTNVGWVSLQVFYDAKDKQERD